MKKLQVHPVKPQLPLQNIPAAMEKREDGSCYEHLCHQPLRWHTGRSIASVVASSGSGLNACREALAKNICTSFWK